MKPGYKQTEVGVIPEECFLLGGMWGWVRRCLGWIFFGGVRGGAGG
jgi:hypothetical protein